MGKEKPSICVKYVSIWSVFYVYALTFNIFADTDPVMGEVESKPESVQTGRAVGGLEGICPRCNSGQLEEVKPGKYVPLRRSKNVELVNRVVYRCNNPNCGYENVAMVLDM